MTDKQYFLDAASSVIAGDVEQRLRSVLETPAGQRLFDSVDGQPLAEVVSDMTPDAAMLAWASDIHQSVDAHFDGMRGRGTIRGGSVTDTGVFKSAAIWRDSRPVPRHQRQHFVVVHFTAGEPQVFRCPGVAWRIAKRAIAQHVRRQRDVVVVCFVMQPVPPVERITFKSTVGEAMP